MKPPETSARLAYRPVEVCSLIGVPRSTVYEWLRTGALASVRVGRVRLVPREALEDLLGRHRSSGLRKRA